MKKTAAGILGALVLVSFSTVGFAKAGDYYGHGGMGMGMGGKGDYKMHQGAFYNMTDAQRAQHITFIEQTNKLNAEFLNKEVQAGRMSKAEADAHMTLRAERIKRLKENKAPQPLTEDAIKARQEYAEKMRNLKIDQIKQAIASGTLSQEQGDRIIAKMQDYKGFYGKGDGYHKGDAKGYHRGDNKFHNNNNCPYVK